MNQEMVLYIEDDEGVAKLVQLNLERAGYFVEIADSAEKGLEIYNPSIHKVIVLDHVLPGISGIDALKKFAPSKFDPAVIMLTAAGSEKIAIEAINSGAAEYLVKDDIKGFLQLLPIAIESALAKKKLYKDNDVLQRENVDYIEELRRIRDELQKVGKFDDIIAKMGKKLK
jgi:two-component system, sensor histidine kinase